MSKPYRITLLLFCIVIVQTSKAQPYTLTQADSLHEAGKILFRQGAIKEAAATFQQAMETKQALLPSQHTDIRGSAANLGLTRWRLEEFWASIKAYQIAVGVESAQKNASTTRLGNYYNTIGACYFNLGLYDNAHHHFLEAKQLLSGKPQEAALPGVHLNLALYYLKVGQEKEAIKYLEKVKAGNPSQEIEILLTYNLGDLYFEKAAYARALPHYQEALALLEEYTGYDAEGKRFNTLERIGLTYVRLNQPDTGLQILKTLIEEKSEQYGEKDTRLIRHYYNYGMTLRKLNKWREAELMQKRVITLSKSQDGYTKYQGAAFTELGYLHLDQGKPSSAVLWFEKALRYNEKAYSAGAPEIAESHIDLAKTQQLTGQWAEAIRQSEIGLQMLTGSLPKDWSDYTKLPAVDMSIEGLAVRATSRFRMGEERQDFNQLKMAMADFEQLTELLHFLRSSHTSREAKLDLLRNVKPIYEHALELAYLLQDTYSMNQTATILRLMEQSKSILLYEGWLKRSAEQNGLIPTKWVKVQNTLQKRIVELENTLSAPPETDKEYLWSLRKELDKQHLKFYAIQDSIRRDAPQLYEEMYAPKLASVDDISSLLESETSFIQYFVGENHIRYMVINQDGTYCLQQPKPTDLDHSIQRYLSGIKGYFEKQEVERKLGEQMQRLNIYRKAAHSLYKVLVEPLRPYLHKHLVIVPDETLETLPFDALLTAPVSDESYIYSYPYLIYQYQTQYAYSGTLLHKVHHAKPSSAARNSILIMAPFHEKGYQYKHGDRSMALDRLDSDESGVNAISNLLGVDTKLILGPRATKEEFLRQAPRFRVIHLATHSRSFAAPDDNESLLFFAPQTPPTAQVLRESTIYRLAFNADLVVLSACETAIGDPVEGEGVLSLSRAFAFAGAKSLIATNWLVNTKATGHILTKFYTQLLDGHDKAHALHLAKLAYIEEHRDSEEFLSPYFWSSLSLYGR